MSRSCCRPVAFACLLAVCRCTAAEIDGNVDLRFCMGLGTVMTDKDVCYVIDARKLKGYWEVKVCGGLNYSTPTVLVIGGKFSAMMCATVRVESARDRESAIRKAEELLRTSIGRKISDRAFQKELQAHLGAPRPVGRVEPFRLNMNGSCPAQLAEAAKQAK
jgi:hypothetical protein